MPQLAIAMIVGAGLMAGYKWVTRELQRHSDGGEATARTETEPRDAVGPRDLGALEWDETAQVYRPARDGA